MDKVKLISGVTSFQKLNFQAGNARIYMKRDDLIDFAFGGNKVRLFEYIAADVIDSGAEKIITFGSVHSNHIRVAAAIASRLGISCDLIILYDRDEGFNGTTPNIKLTRYCGNVSTVYCETDKAHDFIDEYLEEQRRFGCSYYWIPGGGHTALAARGYEDAAQEILEQSGEIKIDAVFVPCGTGTTQAGLIKGFGDRIPVYGITVARSVERCKDEIISLLEQMHWAERDCDLINVLPCPIKYGDVRQEIKDIIANLVQSDGVFLDPVYNAKSFLMMVQFLKEHPQLKNAVYLNTGGSPNLFQ